VIPRAPGIRPLLTAELISTTGAMMTALALPWLVLSTTGSPSKAGLVAAVEWLPMALFGIPSGALASRLGPRRTMMVCDIARVPLVAAVPLLHWAGALSFGTLLALAFAVGAFFPAHFASQRTILPSLLGEREGELTRAAAILQAANRLPFVVGPAAAGVLIGAIGASGVLLVDAVSYAASAAILATSVPDRHRRTGAAEGEASGLWAGAGWIARSPLLRPLTLVSAGQELCFQVIFICLPILAYTAFDGQAAVAGLLLASWGAGALAGTLLAVRFADADHMHLVRVAYLTQSLPLWALALPAPAALLGVALFASGLANPVANAPSIALVTVRSPEALRAKVMIAYMTAATTAGGIGLFIAGPAAEALGARDLLLVMAALCTAVALWFTLTTRRRGGIVARAITASAPREY